MPRKNKIILSMLLACTMLFTTAAAYEFNGEFADSTFSVNHSLSDDGTAILVYIFDTRIEADTVIDEALMPAQTAASVWTLKRMHPMVYTLLFSVHPWQAQEPRE